MNYYVFDQMRNGPFVRKPGETEQDYMWRVFSVVFERGTGDPSECFNDLLNPELVSCDAENHSLTLRFTRYGWTANPAGRIHGGILASAVDIACGTLTRFMTVSSTSVTTALNLNYLRAEKEGDSFTVTAVMDKCGRRLHFLRAEAFGEDGRLLLTATCQFL